MSDRPLSLWWQPASVVSTDVAGAGMLQVQFDDDIECVLDLTAATQGGPQAQLADVDFLRRVSVDSDRRMLVWPNGFEINLDMVHTNATVQQREQALGPEHPEALTARFRLACLYFAAGDNESAMAVGESLDEAPAEFLLSLAEQTLADAERELGADDPRVKAVRDGLQDVLREAGVSGDGSMPQEQGD